MLLGYYFFLLLLLFCFSLLFSCLANLNLYLHLRILSTTQVTRAVNVKNTLLVWKTCNNNYRVNVVPDLFLIQIQRQFYLQLHFKLIYIYIIIYNQNWQDIIFFLILYFNHFIRIDLGTSINLYPNFKVRIFFNFYFIDLNDFFFLILDFKYFIRLGL